MFRPSLTLALLTLPGFALAQDAPKPLITEQKNAIVHAPLPADQAAMKAHVMFLASDVMKGREAGTHEYDVAANYVASQFYAAGLQPAGDAGSYLQTVPMLGYKPADKGSMAVTRSGSQPAQLVFGQDYIPGANPEQADTSITAPVVFVGYGIDAPQFKRADYAGVDVRGKIVAYFGGAPASFPGEERAHFGNNATKAMIAAKRGAAAVLLLESPITARVRPFSRQMDSWDERRMTWADKEGRGHLPAAGTPSLGLLSLNGAAKLFAGAKTSWADVVKHAETEGATFRPEQLPGTLSVTLKTEIAPVKSYNVAGMLPGSDPKVGQEVVVLSAHLDHVGVGKAVNGDTIYNGAMDNAVGIASLIEEAKRFKAGGKPPRRSILFLAVTAEEKGLIGAEYFAYNPTVPKANLVANVNLDMPVITYKFDDVIAFGAQHSTLGATVKRAAASIGVGVGEDPTPEQGFFTRSDHYRFVQQGVPSVFLWPGQAGIGKAAFGEFLSTHYHQPSDEVAQQRPILWDQGVRFVEANYAIAREIADADDRPRWNKGDFFGLLYNGYGAK